MRVFNYDTLDGYYVWQSVIDAGLASKDHIPLNQYTSYNADFFKPHVFFDPWPKMLDLIPRKSIVHCADMGPETDDNRMLGDYIRATNNTQIDCAMNDTIWFSPACRRNLSQCVPFITQYEYGQTMQLSYFLNWPIAMLKVCHGSAACDKLYYDAVRQGQFFFEWFQPDNSLIDASNRLPVILNLPTTNQLEHFHNIFRTGNANVQPRNYAWQKLASVDRFVAFLVSNMNFYQQDIDGMMVASGDDLASGLNDVASSRRIACDWVQAQEARWREWIPVLCPSGSQSASLVTCAPCVAGIYCPGGFSEPAPCPDHRTTAIAAAVAEADCTQCDEGYILTSGRCFSVGNLIACIVVPLVFAIGAAAAAGFLCGASAALTAEERLVQAKSAELRQELGLTRDNGFVLDSEWAAAGKRLGAVRVLRRAEVDAAARLAMLWRDAEPRLVDGFVSCVAAHDGPVAARLRRCLLRICAVLLDPAELVATTGPADEASAGHEPAAGAESVTAGGGPKGGVAGASQKDRFVYFRDKLCGLQVLPPRTFGPLLPPLVSSSLQRFPRLRSFRPFSCPGGTGG